MTGGDGRKGIVEVEVAVMEVKDQEAEVVMGVGGEGDADGGGGGGGGDERVDESPVDLFPPFSIWEMTLSAEKRKNTHIHT